MQYINKTEIQGVIGTIRVSTIGMHRTAVFSIMTERMFKTGKGDCVCEATWHNCTATEGRDTDPAIFLAAKGTPVNISGRIRNNRYTAADGTERIFTEIVAEKVKVLDGKKERTVTEGDRIRIIRMDDKNGKDPQAAAYNGKEGTVTHIDGIGQIHGTWGGLAINPELDEFTIING